MTIPDQFPSKTYFGIPEDASYVLVLGRLFKLHPVFDDIIINILLRNTKVYILLVRESVSSWNEIIWLRLKNKIEFEILQNSTSYTSNNKWNTSAVLNRLRFIPYDFYSDALLQAEVVLDTFPYGGCLYY